MPEIPITSGPGTLGRYQEERCRRQLVDGRVVEGVVRRISYVDENFTWRTYELLEPPSVDNGNVESVEDIGVCLTCHTTSARSVCAYCQACGRFTGPECQKLIIVNQVVALVCVECEYNLTTPSWKKVLDRIGELFVTKS